MANPGGFAGFDPKKDRDAFLKRRQDMMEDEADRLAHKKVLQREEEGVHEGIVREAVKEGEQEELKHTERMVEHTKKEQQNRKEIEILKQKRKEEEAHRAELKKQSLEEQKKHKQYMEDMHKAAVVRWRAEERKKKSHDEGRRLRGVADAEAHHTKQELDLTEHRSAVRLEDQYRKIRGDLDEEERSLKAQAEEEVKAKRAKLDMQEKAALYALDNVGPEYSGPTLLPQKLARRERLEKDFQKKRTDLEVQLRMEKSAIEASIHKKRGQAMMEEREAKALLLSQTKQQKLAADKKAGEDKKLAGEVEEEILHNTEPEKEE